MNRPPKRDRIVSIVKTFIANQPLQQPLLVGFSGGADSTALLYLLREAGVKSIHVAHVDHGWRAESALEAEILKERVEAMSIPFHLHRLQGVPMTEEAAREARLNFFRSLYEREGCQAVVLGHQADDQAETVLKRLFEGSSIAGLRGIQPITSHEGMPLWRPLLEVEKRDLERWLQERGIPWLDDATNRDPRYLRAKMRSELIPLLNTQFGKEVGSNLRRLGRLAEELDGYLERQTTKFEAVVTQRGDAVVVDLSQTAPLEPLEVKRFLKRIAEKNTISLSYRTIDLIYRLLEKGTVKRVSAKGGWIEVGRRSIAFNRASDYLGS